MKNRWIKDEFSGTERVEVKHTTFNGLIKHLKKLNFATEENIVRKKTHHFENLNSMSLELRIVLWNFIRIP